MKSLPDDRPNYGLDITEINIPSINVMGGSQSSSLRKLNFIHNFEAQKYHVVISIKRSNSLRDKQWNGTLLSDFPGAHHIPSQSRTNIIRVVDAGDTEKTRDTLDKYDIRVTTDAQGKTLIPTDTTSSMRYEDFYGLLKDGSAGNGLFIVHTLFGQSRLGFIKAVFPHASIMQIEEQSFKVCIPPENDHGTLDKYISALDDANVTAKSQGGSEIFSSLQTSKGIRNIKTPQIFTPRLTRAPVRAPPPSWDPLNQLAINGLPPAVDIELLLSVLTSGNNFMPRLTAIGYAFNKEGSRSILLTIGDSLDLELFLRNNDHSIKLGLQEMGLFCATISIPVPGRLERIAPIWPSRTKQLEASHSDPPKKTWIR